MPDFYTLDEAAKALKIPQTALNRLIKNEQIDVIKLDSKNVRISATALHNIRPAKPKAKAKAKPPTPAQLLARENFKQLGLQKKAVADARKHGTPVKPSPADPEAAKPKNGAAVVAKK